MNDPKATSVTFTRMDRGTVADYALLDELAKPYIAQTGERVLAYLDNLKGGFPGYQVDRYEHSLQTATRAHKAGECEEFVVAALLHDIGDDLAPENHAELGAGLLRPYVAEHTYWMVLQHGLFQGYYYFGKTGGDANARDRHKDHPAYDMTVRFCAAYDQLSFDPDYESFGIDHFAPMVERIFAREPWGDHATRKWPSVE